MSLYKVVLCASGSKRECKGEEEKEEQVIRKWEKKHSSLEYQGNET